MNVNSHDHDRDHEYAYDDERARKVQSTAPTIRHEEEEEEEDAEGQVQDAAEQALEDHLTRQLSHPPFLVKTKTQEEKETMRQQFKKQQEHRRNPAIRGPYEWIGKLYARFSTSFMLENTSSVARDHLANERTFLAWLRTSLSLITVGVAITQLYHLTPQTGGDNTNQVTQAKIGKALGGVFVIFSIVFLYFANARYFHTQLAMTKGQFPASRGAVVFGSTCILAVLVAMFVVIVSDLR